MADVTVKLKIAKIKTDGSWAQATNGDGQPIEYYYKFFKKKGGPNDDGNVVVTTKDLKTTIKVKLAPDSKDIYNILTAVWKSQENNDMKVDLAGPDKLKIINKATTLGSNDYTVIVTEQPPAKRKFILCDPRISNQWPPLVP